MSEYYTFKEAMERLGLRSVNAFRQLERKYPDVFANVSPYTSKSKAPRYDKAALDKFADMREYFNEHFKQEKP